MTPHTHTRVASLGWRWGRSASATLRSHPTPPQAMMDSDHCDPLRRRRHPPVQAPVRLHPAVRVRRCECGLGTAPAAQAGSRRHALGRAGGLGRAQRSIQVTRTARRVTGPIRISQKQQQVSMTMAQCHATPWHCVMQPQRSELALQAHSDNRQLEPGETETAGDLTPAVPPADDSHPH